MASPRPGQDIQEEIKCPICLEYLTDPVTLECGHNFCRACISDYCEKWEEHESLECPVCRAKIQKGNLRPNWQLANVVEGIKHLEFVPGAEDLCVSHKKELSLFCEEDGVAVCVACERSPEHSSHKVLLIEKASQKYKEQIQDALEFLREERKRLEDLRVNESQKHQEYQEMTKAERQKVVSEFKRLHQMLEKQEQLLLARLAELEREIEKSQEETVTKLSDKMSHLNCLIREMESKCQQQSRYLLQDIKSTLSRCKKEQFQLLGGISPELQTRLNNWSELNLRETFSLLQDSGKVCPDFTNHRIKEFVKHIPVSGYFTNILVYIFCDHIVFPDNLQSYLEKGSYSKVMVTLDPHTAHPCLVLSVDWRSVRRADTQQHLPNNPERFDRHCCVLGREGFTSGRHCWEVEVQEWGFWAMGVAKESVKRKGKIHISPEEGIWAVQRGLGQFQALMSPHPTPLSLRQAPSRVRVCLDYAGRRVSFLDADTEDPIYVFQPASFNGDRIRPWLCLGGVEVKLRLCH
ncbi:tripartite motif-containing protein 10-like [Alligator sinensis]|uniref:Tripartite motif-containing protein 10-like n=1 Tax=Alligator sinensis TaxID=38654 RepID=A0A3Q0G7N2_ALLSI|nr:tripartite motif-containing protein 10-like [Alligator sinensis]